MPDSERELIFCQYARTLVTSQPSLRSEKPQGYSKNAYTETEVQTLTILYTYTEKASLLYVTFYWQMQHRFHFASLEHCIPFNLNKSLLTE